MTAIYITKGTLTNAIPEEGIREAQAYLTEDDMTQYIDPPLSDAMVRVQWKLESDGYHWSVEAITNRELTEAELKELSQWVSGQNSDGLGEGFEQQDFAWSTDTDDCGDCEGCNEGWSCEDDGGAMCSFDWKTNDCAFERVR